jgi:hypothetical protein
VGGSEDDRGPLVPDQRRIAFGGKLGDLGSQRQLPSAKELHEGGLVASAPWQHFSPAERTLAQWLREQGVEVLSSAARTGEGEATPDAVLLDVPVTVELKALDEPTPSAIRARVRIARRGQSRRVVIDGRAVGLMAEFAVSGIDRALSVTVGSWTRSSSCWQTVRRYSGGMDERTVYVATAAGEDAVRAAVQAWVPAGFTAYDVEFAPEGDDEGGLGVAVDLYSPIEPDTEDEAGLARSVVRLRDALRAALPYEVELDKEIYRRELARLAHTAH